MIKTPNFDSAHNEDGKSIVLVLQDIKTLFLLIQIATSCDR